MDYGPAFPNYRVVQVAASPDLTLRAAAGSESSGHHP